jgi:hypothetical protein
MKSNFVIVVVKKTPTSPLSQLYSYKIEVRYMH